MYSILDHKNGEIMTIFKKMYLCVVLFCMLIVIGMYVLFISMEPKIAKLVKELYGIKSKWKGLATFHRQRL